MALSNPRAVYGVHSVAPYSRTTALPYGIAKVLEGSSFSIKGEMVKLFGGSNRHAWAVEDSTEEAEVAIKAGQVEDWMFEIFLGKAPTLVTTPGTSGAVSTVTNVNGTSAVASTGIASVSAKSSKLADMKFGKYVIYVESATTVSVYCYSDVDFIRGTDKEFVNDAGKITSSNLTITQSAAVEVPDFGIEITGGAGVIAMTVGNTATFEVHPPYTKKMEVVIGNSNNTKPEFGLLMVAQQRSTGEMFEIDAYRCKGNGMPIGLQQKEFAKPELNAMAFWDSTKNAVAGFRWVVPS